MDSPVIMEKPTAFGINASGQIMAGGEGGREVVPSSSFIGLPAGILISTLRKLWAV